MARRRNRDTTFNGISQRDLITSNRSLASLLTPIRLPLPSLPLPDPAPLYSPPVRAVASIGDRRRYAPGRQTRPPAAVYPGAARLVASPRVASGVRFASPPHVSICAKRKVRKQVLFSLKKTRKGSRSKRTRNFWSEVHCK